MLQYLAIIHNSGKPIYSKCFNQFCNSIRENRTELNDFIEALQDIPNLLESKNTRKEIFLEHRVLLYRESTDEEFVFLAVFPESMRLNSTCEDLKRLFDNFYSLFASNFYKKLDWDDLAPKQYAAIQSNLEKRVLRPWCYRADLIDCWSTKNECILDMDGKVPKKPYWEIMKDIYTPLNAKS